MPYHDGRIRADPAQIGRAVLYHPPNGPGWRQEASHGGLLPDPEQSHCSEIQRLHGTDRASPARVFRRGRAGRDQTV